MLIDMLIIINNIVDNNKKSMSIIEIKGGLFYEVPKNVDFSNVDVTNSNHKLSTGYVEKWMLKWG